MAISSLLFDKQAQRWSLMTTMKVGDYLALVESAHENHGAPERLSEARQHRVRESMVSDIAAGAVLPPLVLGIHVDAETFAATAGQPSESIEKNLLSEWKDKVSIIDGMQRTAALLDATSEHPDVFHADVRVECWISAKTENLAHRGRIAANSSLAEELQSLEQSESLSATEMSGACTSEGPLCLDSLIDAYLAKDPH